MSDQHPDPHDSRRCAPPSDPPPPTPTDPLRPGTLPSLTRLGWDEAWSATLARHLERRPRGPEGGPPSSRTAAPVLLGRVVRADRGACDVLLPEPSPAGHRRVHGVRWTAALSRAAAADPERAPATGDWVLLGRPDRPEGRAADDEPRRDEPGWTVGEVLERRTAVRRAEVDPGSSRSQVLAANADVVAVVEAMPAVPGRLERLLALAWSSGAQPVVVLTKADLHGDPVDAVARVTVVCPGVDVLAVASPEGHGLGPLRERLAGGLTLALVGASGVGKSTLLNALVTGGLPGAEVMRTQELRSDGKGRHTTVTRELHLAPHGGAVLDTPGVRVVGLSGDEALDDVFPDVLELAARCRFADCAHRTEPGCAVLAAIATGDLPERRLASFRTLEREALARAVRTDARLRAAQRRELTVRQRAYRQRPDKKR
ncbi:MAG TPA: ribosome small subunit-dependent GTPase A [Actinotalea sp.]|nr:ribosome small subunit-dependent GTPase A [Actinotalea sp.]